MANQRTPKFVWKNTARIGYGEDYVSRAEAEELITRLVVLGNGMSVEMMKQMLQGLRDEDFIHAHDNYHQFVLDKGLRTTEHPEPR